MVEVKADHLGRTAGSAAALDGSRGAIADLEETHEAGGCAAAAQFFTLAPEAGEVGAHAGSVFEDPGLTHPEVHDAAIIHQVILNGEDETGMRLGALIGGRGFLQLPVCCVHIIVSLGLALDAIGFIEPGVEPLGTVGHAGLVEDAVDQLIVEYLCIIPGGEIAVALTPNPPAVGHAMGDLLGRGLPSQGSVRLGNTRLAEIFLGQDVRSDLAPGAGDLHVVHFKHDLPAWIADHGRAVIVFEHVEHADVVAGELATEFKAVGVLDFIVWHCSSG